jgi:hypothetical protein
MVKLLPIMYHGMVKLLPVMLDKVPGKLAREKSFYAREGAP